MAASDLWDHSDCNEARARIYLVALQVAGDHLGALACAGAYPPPA